MMVVCYKVNYLPVGVRIRFRVNAEVRFLELELGTVKTSNFADLRFQL